MMKKSLLALVILDIVSSTAFLPQVVSKRTRRIFGMTSKESNVINGTELIVDANSNSPWIDSSSLIFSDDQSEQSSRQAAFDRLQTTLMSLADFEGKDAVRLIQHSDAPADALPINSLVFQVTGSHPLLVVLPSAKKVDLKKLETHLEQGNDDERISLYLSPEHLVEQICGFPPKSVPPLGHSPNSLRTIVDVQLLQDGLTILGGGGHPNYGTLIALETLMKITGTEFADIADNNNTTGDEKFMEGSLSSRNNNDTTQKPFFPIAPPDRDTVELLLQNSSMKNPFSPQRITVLGRINGVRRMARRLVFCDFAPPDYVGTGTKMDSYDNPWRSGVDGGEMSVQLIAGKTLCRRLGDSEGSLAIKRFRPGQLILVDAKTNCGNLNSLDHWREKRSLDLVVFGYQLLQDAKPKELPPPIVRVETATVQTTSAEKRIQELSAMIPPTTDEKIECLSLSEVLPNPVVKVVDTKEATEAFASDVASLSTNGDPREIGVVGMDMEWKPSFLIPSPTEPQPVLLLQMSLASLGTVYLIDLQALARPCLDPSEPMNEKEEGLSNVLADIFASQTIIKVGYQLKSDLRRLGASYPHIEAFRLFHGVVELSSVAKKAMQMNNIRNSKQLTMSLSKLTQYLLSKPLNKEQQISDWSERPLNDAQIEYASLDAAVTAVLLEKSLELVDGGIIDNTLQIGRYKDDQPFMKAILSVRFMFLDTNDATAIRKLKAKQIVSNLPVVTQSWITGTEEPSLPSVPANNGGGPYTDVQGILRMPAIIVNLGSNIRPNFVDELIGERLGKSKDSCLSALLDGNADMPEGAKLEYHQRAGYIEFDDGVAMFVNMPRQLGEPAPRGYPNVWLDEGRGLSWFLREGDWKDGNSKVARKILAERGDGSQNILLFVRMGRGEFLCCGPCKVGPNDGSGRENNRMQGWGLIELNLRLLAWERLQDCTDFRKMTSEVEVEDSESGSISDGDTAVELEAKLTELVLEGNIVGAMNQALSISKIPKGERSLNSGVEALKSMLISSSDPKASIALEKLELLGTEA